MVARCCHHAARAGIRPMMSLPLAEALIPGAYIEPFDPLRDFHALHTLAVWCLRFSPLVSLDTELLRAHARHELSMIPSTHYGITIDLTGTERVHGDFGEFGDRFSTLFQGNARVAIAPTLGGAWALSRYGSSHPIVTPSLPALYDAIAELPTIALRIDPSCVALLGDVGIYTISQLTSLPRHTLARRFGKTLLYRLNQTLGHLEERLIGVEARTRHERYKIFEPPLTNRYAITRAIEYLFRDLLNDLRQRSIIARHFALSLVDTTHHRARKEFSLASATNDATHLFSIVQPIIDSMKFCGELRELRLLATHTERAVHAQRAFTSSRGDAPDIERAHAELLNTLSVRIGRDRVVRAALRHSYIPERSFSYHSALTQTEESASTLHEPPPPYNLRERPSTLLATPEPIRTIAMLPDKPPSFIHWRDTHLTVRAGFGPERIAPEWWHDPVERSHFSERDYFTIQDNNGRWLWVFRDQRTHEWFLHGVWT